MHLSPPVAKAALVLLFLTFCLLLLPLIVLCFCCTLLYAHSSIAIFLMGKRELAALLNLSSWCLVTIERLFLAVPWGCLQFVIVVFPDHTYLLFLIRQQDQKWHETTKSQNQEKNTISLSTNDEDDHKSHQSTRLNKTYLNFDWYFYYHLWESHPNMWALIFLHFASRWGDWFGELYKCTDWYSLGYM